MHIFQMSSRYHLPPSKSMAKSWFIIKRARIRLACKSGPQSNSNYFSHFRATDFCVFLISIAVNRYQAFNGYLMMFGRKSQSMLMTLLILDQKFAEDFLIQGKNRYDT